jgi:hypothetical protein
MANQSNKQQPKNDTHHHSVWEIPVSKLPNKAADLWGHYHPQTSSEESTEVLPRAKIKRIPSRKATQEKSVAQN